MGLTQKYRLGRIHYFYVLIIYKFATTDMFNCHDTIAFMNAPLNYMENFVLPESKNKSLSGEKLFFLPPHLCQSHVWLSEIWKTFVKNQNFPSRQLNIPTFLEFGEHLNSTNAPLFWRIIQILTLKLFFLGNTWWMLGEHLWSPELWLGNIALGQRCDTKLCDIVIN